MSEESSILKQNQFADYCRTGVNEDLNIPAKREYRTMILQNFDLALRNAYPITLRVLGEDKWTELVHSFVLNYKCTESQFWKMPGLLVQYEMLSGWGKQNDINWLIDSLKFEWTQVELFFRVNWKVVELEEFTGALNSLVVFHNEFEIITLEYPIHLANWEDAGQDRGTYFVLMYRNQDDYKVQIMELSPFLAIFTEELFNSKISADQVLDSILTVNQIGRTVEIEKSSTQFLLKLKTIGLIKGVLK